MEQFFVLPRADKVDVVVGDKASQEIDKISDPPDDALREDIAKSSQVHRLSRKKGLELKLEKCDGVLGDEGLDEDEDDGQEVLEQADPGL